MAAGCPVGGPDSGGCITRAGAGRGMTLKSTSSVWGLPGLIDGNGFPNIIKASP